MRVAHTTLELPASEGEQLLLLAGGQPLPSQMRIERRPTPGRSDGEIDRVHLTVALPTRALGLTWLTRGDRRQHPTPSVADPVTLEQTTTGWRLANAQLRLDIDAAGAITLHDRRSGHSQALGLHLESHHDAGDSYDFSPLPGDAGRRSGAALRPPEALDTGPLRSTLRWPVELTLPARLADDRRTPHGRVLLRAELAVTLEAFAEHAALSVTFEQTACDQRLRLRLSSGIHADHVLADAHWHQERIPVSHEAHPHWYQQPVDTHHQRRYTAVCDEQRGLALIARGLPEAAAMPTAGGVDLAVTLVRAVGWLSRDDLLSRPQGAGPALATPGAQCLGTQRMELALAPFAGAADQARLQRAAEAFLHPPQIFSAGFYDPRPDLQLGAASDAGSGAREGAPIAGPEVSEPLLLSALKPADNAPGLVLRLWNPTDRRVAGRLQLPPSWNLHRLLEARLDEHGLREISHERGTVSVELEPSEVLTLHLEPTYPGGER
jgi:hypothetical protein